MSTPITIDADGRLLLPKIFRDKLELKGGTRLKADLTGNKIELTPETENSIRMVSNR